ncbi:hypothetical protein NL676_030627 [Syzygium grande]|nr:hypothetical protein NL676_030627 [Syzygium grande]
MMQQDYVFGNLRSLALACYHNENDVFPSNFLLHRFPNLEILSVVCSSFKEIFPEDASGHGGVTPCGGLTDVEKPLKALGNLKQVELMNLWSLRRVWKDGSLMAEILKHIKIMFVSECPSLSIVFPSPNSFERLTQLEVKDCAGLVHMGICSAVTSLVQLTWLNLSNCDAMEDVITDDGNGAEEISFPKLRELILNDLPSLESFSSSSRAFMLPSLERFVITQCPKMDIFCKGASRTPKLEKILLSQYG